MPDLDDTDEQMPLQLDEEPAAGGARRAVKSDNAFRTISEVAADLEVPQHVLRFWESKFTQVRPLKRGGGRRYYRPEDVGLLKRIRSLLYDDGMTIRGVQKILREPADRPTALTGASPASTVVASGGAGNMKRLIAELTALRDDLREAISA